MSDTSVAVDMSAVGSVLGAARAAIAAATTADADEFRSGAEVTSLLVRRSDLIDGWLTQLWQTCQLADIPDITLLAVGGYGRGQLHPGSDIDLLVLTRAPLSDAHGELVSAFLASVFDLGLKAGPAVRTLAECVEVATDDLTVVTSLMDARAIIGNQELANALHQAIAPANMWSSFDFHAGKVDEQNARHRRFDNADYNLEPNVKTSPGGLRDVQTISWVAQRHFGTADLRHLMTLGFLTRNEHDALAKAEHFFSRVRYGLHVLASRAEDRLLFDRQQDLASLFGYSDRPGQLGVEQLMHDYYRHSLEIQALNDMLLQHLAEALLPTNDEPAPAPEVINDRFQVVNRYLEVRHSGVFREEPGGLIEVFVLLAHRADLLGVRAATIRLIREHIHLIDDDFRTDPRNNAMFMRLLRSQHRLVSQLTRMRRYGVLGSYLPEFGRIVGQMQHDLFHIYTVDTHTMQLIRNLRRFVSGVSREAYPVASQCVAHLPRIELLYLAGLYHDLGKGRGGDHSSLGAIDARAFCQQHGLTEEENELVSWLVKQHLEMSSIAQRQDLSDPHVIQAFAEQVGTLERLNYLYALTVADITATNPELWNSWRAALLRQLYAKTRAVLIAGDVTPQTRQERLRSCQAAALARLAENGLTEADCNEVWIHVDDEYFLQTSPGDIAWQTEAMLAHDLTTGPLARVRLRTQAQMASGVAISDVVADSGDGAIEVFLYTRNQPNLFAATVAVLDGVGLSVQDAQIHTSSGDVCVNTFIVLDERPSDPDRLTTVQAQLESRLSKALLDPNTAPEIATRLVPARDRHFSMPTSAVFEDQPRGSYSRLRVVATDRPGLLAQLGTLFMQTELTVRSAKISTLGERVEDTFELSEADTGEAITDPQRQQDLAAEICARLDELLGHE